MVEIDDAGVAHLRFGNGDEGRQPEAGASFSARYRVGNGPAGNVGRRLYQLPRFPKLTEGTGALLPRNPLAAAGGTAPEAAADVRHGRPVRAFAMCWSGQSLPTDYTTLARQTTPGDRPKPARPIIPGHPPRQAQEEEPANLCRCPPDFCLIPFTPLQNARGTLCWNGSWYEARVASTRWAPRPPMLELLAEVDAYLTRYRRIGHDLAVTPARYCRLDLGLSICVKPLYLQAQVAALLRQCLGTGVLPDGTLALFNPDRLTFGQAVYLSPIIAAAQSIPGVLEVQVTRLAPLVPGRPPPRQLARQRPRNGHADPGPERDRSA